MNEGEKRMEREMALMYLNSDDKRKGKATPTQEKNQDKKSTEEKQGGSSFKQEQG